MAASVSFQASRARVVGIALPAVLIAVLSPLLGVSAWVLTAPLFFVQDPLTGAQYESAAHGAFCFGLAHVVVSAAVGFFLVNARNPSTRRSWIAGAVGGALLFATWIVSEALRGVVPGLVSVSSGAFVVALASASSAAGAWVALRRESLRLVARTLTK